MARYRRLSAVDQHHQGIATARVAGLIAVALAGLAFDRNAATVSSENFRIAALIGAGTAVLAGVCGLVMVRERPTNASRP